MTSRDSARETFQDEIPGALLPMAHSFEVSPGFVKLLQKYGASPRLLRKLKGSTVASEMTAAASSGRKTASGAMRESQRRTQALIDRLIDRLAQLERGEENPGRLAELFQLDHLATRMRRHEANTSLLAGDENFRVQNEPASLLDILRAAQSEIEEYARIELEVADPTIGVKPHAVNDLVHLIAEIFDNATAFSPPHKMVAAKGQRANERVLITVEDLGLGIDQNQQEKYNEALAAPTSIYDFHDTIGLKVVGLLAKRHDIAVRLVAGARAGTVAEIWLPADLLSAHSETISPLRGDEATSLFRQVLVERERVLGSDHLDTLTSRHDLASALQSAGHLDEAIILFKRVLAERERVLGRDHPDTLTSRHDLAGALQSAGHLEEAISLFEQVLAEQEQSLGARHPFALASRQDLAGALRSAGRLDEAITVFQQVLTDLVQVLGSSHPNTLSSRRSLAGVYQSAGRVEEAITLLQQGSSDHPKTPDETPSAR